MTLRLEQAGTLALQSVVTFNQMYTRPRFLEELHAIREEMSRECDYDMDLFAQLVNSLDQEIIEALDPEVLDDNCT